MSLRDQSPRIQSARIRRALRLPPRPEPPNDAYEQTVSMELARVATAAGLAHELARLDCELGHFRAHCTCGTASDARRVRWPMEGPDVA